MDVFYHLLYEHSRGLRDLALYTIDPAQRDTIEHELKLEGVAFLMRPLEDGRLNVYFGHRACIDVIQSFGGCPHCRLTPEQDFMLGIMLGYDRTRQCERYIGRLAMCREAPTPCGKHEAPARCVREPDAEHALG
jgi:hypothetical protein